MAVYQCSEGSGAVDVKTSLVTVMDNVYNHTSAVKRLRWRPRTNVITLASCSLDHCVKIFNFDL